tara:strand:+ start:293 stop:439 length:147 start_codon:yes stop_codon:yes gene_type:complete
MKSKERSYSEDLEYWKEVIRLNNMNRMINKKRNIDTKSVNVKKDKSEK